MRPSHPIRQVAVRDRPWPRHAGRADGRGNRLDAALHRPGHEWVHRTLQPERPAGDLGQPSRRPVRLDRSLIDTGAGRIQQGQGRPRRLPTSSRRGPRGVERSAAHGLVHVHQPRPSHGPSHECRQPAPLLHPGLPASVEGLVQLRMYFSGVNLTEFQRPYPATTLRVSGNRWSVVSGGPSPATSATPRRVSPRSAELGAGHASIGGRGRRPERQQRRLEWAVQVRLQPGSTTTGPSTRANPAGSQAGVPPDRHSGRVRSPVVAGSRRA